MAHTVPRKKILSSKETRHRDKIPIEDNQCLKAYRIAPPRLVIIYEIAFEYKMHTMGSLLSIYTSQALIIFTKHKHVAKDRSAKTCLERDS